MKPAKEKPRHLKAYDFWLRLILLDEELSEAEIVRKCASKFRVSEQAIKNWIEAFDWRERAKLLIKEKNEKALAKLIEGIAKMNARHVEKTKEIQKQLIKQLKELKPQSISEGVKGYETLVTIERRARGEPTEIKKEQVEIEADIEITESDEELRRMAEDFLEWQNRSK